MFRLSCDIQLGNLRTTQVHSVEITESYRTLTNTAVLVLPRKVDYRGKTTYLQRTDSLKEGDKVSIQLGYDGKLVQRFTGYVRRVGSSFPVEITCENEAYVLKKHMVAPKVFKSATLNEVLAYIVPQGLAYRAGDTRLGRFIIAEEVPAGKVLDEIFKQYRLYSFFRDGVLYSGLPFWSDYQRTVAFKFGHNIIEWPNLKYLKKEDIKIKLRAVSIQPDNSKTEVSVGDEQGELRTFYYHNIASAAELKKQAETLLNEFTYDGLQGSFVGFGEPYVQQGDIVRLLDGLDSEAQNEGRYLCEKVVTRFGFDSGYRQQIDLGKRMGT